ncbi:MAG: hypothetical protein QNJ12_14895 [Ilumatobacter sp.]|uniref:hypothetical protein n=1 Tax=Ilumatobacter sp. TaxID=1967498 RepID=UPI0026359301|nr:hypothetical protein [Ilumatobacter sp.]MDJ0770086.1 hypothetical protein [Ilumatobacter sp.]
MRPSSAAAAVGSTADGHFRTPDRSCTIATTSVDERLTGEIEHLDDDSDLDTDRLAVCAYWRCAELFERRTANQRYCRKACRRRQNKWLRAQERRRSRAGASGR